MLNGEKFLKEIKDVDYGFALKENKILKCDSFEGCDGCAFQGSCRLNRIKWLLEEYKEPILTEEEKIIIKDIIKASEPFNKKPVYISKIEYFSTVGECFLEIKYEDDRTSTPNFKYDELFKGMELRKEYSLKELGL